MEKPKYLNTEELVRNKIYYWIRYIANEEEIFRMESHGNGLFCFVDYPTYACRSMLSHFEIFDSLEEAEYALEYNKWDKEVNNKIAKESKFLKSLAWTKEESEHRKKMYEVYRRGWLLTRKEEHKLNKINDVIKLYKKSNLGEYDHCYKTQERLEMREEELEEQWSHYYSKLDAIVSKEQMSTKEWHFWNSLEHDTLIKAIERRENRKQLKAQNNLSSEK